VLTEGRNQRYARNFRQRRNNGGAVATTNNPKGYPWPAAPPEIAAADIEEEIDCDVVVVGVATAGACAVRSAAEEGAKVVYFEKGTLISSSSSEMAVLGGDVMAKWGRGDGAFDIYEVAEHEVNEGSYFPKLSIYMEWARNAKTVFDWYLEPDDTKYFPADSFEAAPEGVNSIAVQYYPLPELHNPEKELHKTYECSVRFDQALVNNRNVEKVTAEGNVTGYLGHAVEQLIKEGDRVAGCYAYNYESGKYKKVNASKGVILSCGDYSQNPEMNAFFLPDTVANNIKCVGQIMDAEGKPADVGDGLKMGDWVGAKIQQHHAPMIHHMGGYLIEGDFMSAMGTMGIAPFLRLDVNGQRFMNEDCPGQQFENQIESLEKQVCYMFWDANWGQAIPYNPPTHGNRCYFATPEEAASGRGAGMYVSQNDVDSAVEAGSVLKSDTLDDLLAQINSKWDGIDAQAAAKSIARYTELANGCRAGTGIDEDFGKMSKRVWPIDTAPYYCSRMNLSQNLCNMGGLESDENCHTFDEARNVIPGLYVAGNIQGSRFAIQYPIAVGGIASSLCMYYGYVAGKNVVQGV
jgi:hypothetical protein